MAVDLFTGEPLGRTTFQTVTTVGTHITPTSGTITPVHKVAGGLVCRSTFTIASLLQNVVNGTEYQSSKIWTFPNVRATMIQAYFNIAQTTTSAIATTLNSGVTGAISLGTAAASSVTLNSTMANLVASTAFTSSTTIDVAGTAVEAYLDANNDASEVFTIDATASDVSVYLNTAYATTTDVDADATQTLAGTVILYWFLHGYELGF
jgi:hypothetical protein